jgi:predicted DNA-binding ribbon-helix-helix protein
MESSPIKKRSVVISGHRTSISLEDEFWKTLRQIAWARGETLCKLLSDIDEGRKFGNLSSAIRMFVLQHYLDQLGQQSFAQIEASSHGERRVEST